MSDVRSQRSEGSQHPSSDNAEADRASAELQGQMSHAREMMDQSRRLLRAALSEPRSFRREP